MFKCTISVPYHVYYSVFLLALQVLDLRLAIGQLVYSLIEESGPKEIMVAKVNCATFSVQISQFKYILKSHKWQRAQQGALYPLYSYIKF